MKLDYTIIITTIINVSLLFIILIAVCKGIQWCKDFVSRNKEIDEKLDIILKKLDSEDSNNI
ncbi:hypothetical protein GCM10008908_25670 [Clostridium subterminale]|uniref:Uncharacterized protein n=1 Tax=Clostridium subterminale TaxID=1550 RepID=A0ABP3W668_CLOSU